MLFLQESNLGSTVQLPEVLSCISYQFSVSGSKIKFPVTRNTHSQPSQTLEIRLVLDRRACSELILEPLGPYEPSFH